MKKMNIAIVCDAISFVGGTSVATLQLSEQLSKKGHNVTIISSKYPEDPDFEVRGSIKIYRLPAFPVMPSNKALFLAFPNRKELKKIFAREKTELVHFMFPATFLTWSAIKTAELLGLKITIQSNVQPEAWMVYLPKVLSGRQISRQIVKFAYYCLMRLYKKANAMICPSKFSKEILERIGLKNKMYVISNGVDTSKFRKLNPGRCCEKFNLSTKTVKFLYVGRLDHEKNVSLLINAAQHIKKHFENFEICVVGTGLEETVLKDLTVLLGLQKEVKFLGKISTEDLVKMYNLCDVFVLPSLIELEGMVVLEAMSCGKPILIANSEDSASRYFVNGNGFLVDPYDAKDLAKKALILLENSNLRRKMGLLSYKKSREFDIHKSISKVEEVFYSVLN